MKRHAENLNSHGRYIDTLKKHGRLIIAGCKHKTECGEQPTAKGRRASGEWQHERNSPQPGRAPINNNKKTESARLGDQTELRQHCASIND
uniref:GCM domain-containing protein n=1 Tax=Heterorhabditis bacteriophora TaxID=37862 RepID=A0A1I7X8Z2_HETBA